MAAKGATLSEYPILSPDDGVGDEGLLCGVAGPSS
jgi:hypothetical protein